MAGHRRKHGKPLVRTARTARRTANFLNKLAAAETPGDRVIAAADHVRSALACNPSPEAVQAAERAVVYLQELAAYIHGKEAPR